MPRGHGRRRRKEVDETSVEAQERAQRTVIFSKTKMCKFHILGACTKGAGCKFAHQKEELQELPDLACTKLCKMLISTGSCDDPNCRYAHNRTELKEIPGLPSPLLDQLRETEALRLADAAKAAQRAAAESHDAHDKNEQLKQQLRQRLSHLEQATPKEPSRAMPGITMQTIPALPPELAAQLFPNMPMGGAILSPGALDAGFLINLQNVVAAPTMPFVAPPAVVPQRQDPPPAKAAPRPKKEHRHKEPGGTKRDPGKVLSLAAELPKPQAEQVLASQVQQQLQLQLQQQQEIQRQLRTQLSTQDSETKQLQKQEEKQQGQESPQVEEVSAYPRINTWSGGLNEMEEELLDDPVLELNPVEKVEQSPLAIGLHENFQQIMQQIAAQPQLIPPQIPKDPRLHRVPEDKRLTGMGRQISECSEASEPSTDTPSTEKRLQDTPLQPRRRSDSRGSSPFSAVHEEDEEYEDERPAAKELTDGISPNTKLNRNFGAIVKNTFLELRSDEDEPPRLRTIQTAAGRLDSMGGLPSNPSFETLQ